LKIPDTGGAIGGRNDYFKVNGLTAKITPRLMPETSWIALLCIAGAALFVSRKARKG